MKVFLHLVQSCEDDRSQFRLRSVCSVATTHPFTTEKVGLEDVPDGVQETGQDAGVQAVPVHIHGLTYAMAKDGLIK